MFVIHRKQLRVWRELYSSHLKWGLSFLNSHMVVIRNWGWSPDTFTRFLRLLVYKQSFTRALRAYTVCQPVKINEILITSGTLSVVADNRFWPAYHMPSYTVVLHNKIYFTQHSWEYLSCFSRDLEASRSLLIRWVTSFCISLKKKPVTVTCS